MRAVFLDRDGVINANVERDGRHVAPTSLADFRIIPGVKEAVCRLKDAGFAIVIVTNQPDLRTGRVSQSVIDAMHAEIRRRMPVDDIRICPHIDADGCNCRKPKPGMIVQAAQELGIDVTASYLVGDRWRDIAAGKAAGCVTLFVDYGCPRDGPSDPDIVIQSLSEAATYILDSGHTEGQT